MKDYLFSFHFVRLEGCHRNNTGSRPHPKAPTQLFMKIKNKTACITRYISLRTQNFLSQMDGRPDPPAGTPTQESNPGILEPSGQDLSFFNLRYLFNK